MQKLLFICFLYLFHINGFSQTISFKLTGKIIDIDNLPISAAKIILEKDGLTYSSNKLGFFTFQLPKGEHTLYIEAENYAKKIITVNIFEDKNVGNIILAKNIIELNEIVIKKKPADPLKIEPGKKTYTLANDPTIKGSTLTEVLQNVPSVNIDAEGNVSIRGNENAMILIDGKPSSITGISSVAEALRTIPADMVEKIEVVTNPSSKYDASGSGGVINIVLKKSKKPGFFGSVETYIGNQANAGININLNYKKSKWNYFTTLSYQRFEPSGRTNINNSYLTNSIVDSSQIQKGKRLRVSDNYTLRFGTDYTANDKNSFSFSGILKTNQLNNLSSISYGSYNSLGLLNKEINRQQDGNQKDFTIEGNFGYKKLFESDKHQLTADASIAYTNEDGNNIIYENEVFPIFSLLNQSFNLKNQTQKRFLLQSDYFKQIDENSKIEVGYRGGYKDIGNEIRTNVLDLKTSIYKNDAFFTNATKYIENIQAFYFQYGSKYKKIVYQLGLRSELSIIDVSSISISNKNYTYSDLFPSFNINKSINTTTDVSFNYSRRIDRPNIRFLSPVSSAADNSNVFIGNLLLQPSYTNMLELELNKNYKAVNLSSAVYFSNATNAFTIVRTFNSASNLFVATPVNTDYANRYGADFNVKYSGIKWLKMNANLNLFEYTQKGNYNGININGNGFSWFGRYTSSFTLPNKFLLSTVAMYHGPNKTNNLVTKGIFSINLGLAKDLFKEKATLTLNVNDLLNSSKRLFTNFADNYRSDVDLQFRQRQINLTFMYRFNGAKKEQNKKSKFDEQSSGGDAGGF